MKYPRLNPLDFFLSLLNLLILLLYGFTLFFNQFILRLEKSVEFLLLFPHGDDIVARPGYLSAQANRLIFPLFDSFPQVRHCRFCGLSIPHATGQVGG